MSPRVKPREFVLPRFRQPALAFSGYCVANVSSRAEGIGQPGPRWSVIRLYETVRGKYVAEVLGMSSVEGESTLTTVHVADDPLTVQRKVGWGPLAEIAYRDAGWPEMPDTEEI